MRHFALRPFGRLAAALAATLQLCCTAAAAGDEPLPVREVAEGIFVYEAPYRLAAPSNEGAVGNIGFIVGREAVAVIDTGGSLAAGRRLLAAVRSRTALPIRWVVNTHFHPDHVLGNAAFRGPETRFIGHEALKLALASRASVYLAANARLVGPAFAGTEIVLPDVGVTGKTEIDLGGRILELEAHPTAHTNADLTVYDAATRTWWMADLLFVRHLPAVDGSIKGWIALMERAKTRSVDRVVPGHGPASLGWPEAVAPQERYLTRLADEIRSMIAAGRPIAEAAAKAGVGERDGWELFEDFNARNATAAYKELEWE